MSSQNIPSVPQAATKTSSPRLVAYPRVLLALQLGIALFWVVTNSSLVDRFGRPLGTDFISFWSAGKLAVVGKAAYVYRPADLFGMEQAALPRQAPARYAFFYPPPFLLICWLLAHLPYGWSLLAWLSSNIGVCCAVIRRLAQGTPVLLLFLAYPALWLGIGHGQTSFLVMGLFGAGLLLWDRWPAGAAMICACLIVKPHFAFLPPLLMLVERRIGMLLIWALSIVCLLAASTEAFGIAIWPAFENSMHFARSTLEQGVIGPSKMVSLFAAVQVWHGSIGLAWFCQGILALLAVGTLFLPGWTTCARRFAAVSATMLMTPFALDYDLLLLALPGVVLLRHWDGLMRWQRCSAILMYVLPLFSRVFAMELLLPLGPFVIAAFHLALCRDRAREV